MKNVNRESLARAVAEETGASLSACRRVVEAFFSSCASFLASGDTVELRGHFALMPTLRAPKTAQNPRKRTPVFVPAHMTATARFYYGRDWMNEIDKEPRNPLLVEIEASMSCHHHSITAIDKERE